MKIERLSSQQWDRLKRIRLSALQEAPEAFGSTLDVAQQWSDRSWQEQAEKLPTYIAMIDEADVGMARGTSMGSKEDAYLISMWVSPTVRGKGVGEQLVAAVAGWARAAGFKRLLLDVADDNSAAIALYERLGFEPTGETGEYPPPRSHITEHRRARTL